jgi:hypothetical protein
LAASSPIQGSREIELRLKAPGRALTGLLIQQENSDIVSYPFPHNALKRMGTLTEFRGRINR